MNENRKYVLHKEDINRIDNVPHYQELSVKVLWEKYKDEAYIN